MVTDCAMDIVKTDKPSISVALPRSAADWSLAEQETARSKRQRHLDRVKDYFATQLNLPQHVLTHIEITGQLDKRGNVKWSYAWAPECAADGFRCSNRAEFAKRVQRLSGANDETRAREQRGHTASAVAASQQEPAARAEEGEGASAATVVVEQQENASPSRQHATCDMKALRRIRQLEAALQSQAEALKVKEEQVKQVLEAKNSAEKDWHIQNTQLKTTVASLRKHLNSSKAAHSEVALSLREAVAKNRQLEDALQDQAKAVKVRQEQMRRVLEAQSQAEREWHTQKRHLRETVADLRKQLDRTKANLARTKCSSQVQLENCKRDLGSMRSTLAVLKVHKEVLERERDSLAKRIAEVAADDQLRKVQEQLASAQDDKHKLVVMLRTRNTEVEALKETIGRQAAQLKDLSTWSEYYKSQLEQAETVITGLQRLKCQLISRLAACTSRSC